MKNLFFQLLSRTRFATVHFTLPDGEIRTVGEGLPHIHIEIKKWKVLSTLINKGDVGFAEAVIEGDMTVDNLTALIEWACKNEDAMARNIHGTLKGTLLYQIRRLLTFSSRKAAQKNIMAHYDLGNEFYKLWLDPSMTYSSAIFKAPGEDLIDAQNKKYDRLIEGLQIRPGDRVLEVGCGWGGFFSRAIERTGCHVTAVMNSPEQARHNQELIGRKGLSSHIDLRLMDYRDITGKFDKIVSIEMVEAVGERNWPTYFGKLRSALRAKGQAMIQSITIREDLFDNYRKSTDFIQQYVFPGGMLLTNSVMARKGLEHGLQTTDTFEFGISYADTLKIWRENFQRARREVLAMGFNDRFIRLWDLYLAYCEGAFRSQRINVGQFHLEARHE